MGGSSSTETIGQPVTPSSSRSGNSDTRQQRLVAAEVFEWKVPERFRENLLLMTKEIEQLKAILPILLHEDPVERPVIISSSNEAFERRTSEWFRKRLLLTMQQIQQLQEKLCILLREDPVEQSVIISSSNEVFERRIPERFRENLLFMMEEIQHSQEGLHIRLHKDPVEQPVTPRRRSVSSIEVSKRRTSEWFRERSSMAQQIQQPQEGLHILHHGVFERRISEWFRKRSSMTQQIQQPQEGLHILHHEVGQPVTPSSSISSGNSDTWQQELEEAEVFEWRMSEWFREHLFFTTRLIEDSQEGLHILLHKVFEWRMSEWLREHLFFTTRLIEDSQEGFHILLHKASEWRISECSRRRLLLLTQQIQQHQEELRFLLHEDSDETPVQRSSSYEFLPPNMSELRVVLLGSSWTERSSVGNFILGETQFNTEEEPDCVTKRGWMNEKEIVVINTPDLLPSSSFQQRLHETCKSLSDPGPHVFLILIQPEDFTWEDEIELCRFLELFSDQSFDHSLVLISTPRQESSGFMERYIQDPPIKEMIRKCKYRFLWRKNLEHPQLLTRLGQVVKENNGEHVH